MQKTVIVTGATGGIGSAIAETFASRGAFVVGIYHNNRERADAFSAQHPASAFFPCDFSDVSAASALGKRLAAAYDADCVINCAGISHVSVFQEEDDDALRRIMNVNLLSPMAFTRELLPRMISAKRGAILNVSSIWGEYGGSCEVAYSATKGGLNAFTKALARELGASGIRVNALSCGFIDTAINARFSEEDKRDFASSLALGELGAPRDVAAAAYFLCSDEARYVTGQILGVDGGF